VKLGRADRARAAALHRALRAAREAISAGERDAARARAAGLAELAAAGIEPDYLELVCPTNLTPVTRIDGRAVMAVIAARVGPVRLTDNELVQPPAEGVP
jgi:pantoate--beta-alanine ligase